MQDKDEPIQHKSLNLVTDDSSDRIASKLLGDATKHLGDLARLVPGLEETRGALSSGMCGRDHISLLSTDLLVRCLTHEGVCADCEITIDVDTEIAVGYVVRK